MSYREATDKLAAALERAGVSVRAIERRTDVGDADLIRLADDHYMAVDFEDAERAGVVGVSWNSEMPAGGNPTHQSWLMPPYTPDAIAAAMAIAI